MKLYKIVNKIGIWWVIAQHPTQAEEILIKHLNEADYGFSKDRTADSIELISTEAEDKRFISGHFLLQQDSEIINKSLQLIKDLAEWSVKYPRGIVYPMHETSMDDELIQLEDRAKDLVKNLP